MSEHRKAVDKLKAARDALMAKIVERVNDCDDFVDSFTSEFSLGDEAIMDLGEKLYRVNQILNNMPFDAPGEPPPDDCTWIMEPDAAVVTNHLVVCQFPTWDDYMDAVMISDYRGATNILVKLADVDISVAEKATHIFAGQMNLDPTFEGKARSMRAQLCANTTGSLNLIRELFGITGPTAVKMYEALKVTL
jgi:hypothetical protein